MLFLALPLMLALPTTKHTRFNVWMQEHGKTYATVDDEAAAFKTWSANDDKIELHNGKRLGYTLGHNRFSDMTANEFFGQRLGYKSNGRNGTTPRTMHVATGTSLPTSVDWVSAGAVTSVKNQGQCGSCWSFSAAGAIEGAYKIAGGALTDLSEEMLVQCDTTDSGCNGGLMDNAFDWVASHGIASLADYPYTSTSGTRGTCNSEAEAVVTVSGHTDVTSGDEDALKSAVAQQPVSVAIEADQSVFQLYSSGVLDSTSCGTSLDHGVLLVGYGTDASSGKDYWKVKNSWGTTWGEEGYVRLVRGSNMCGIASEASYPTGAASASTDLRTKAITVEETN
jgi:C1A family cysteine protease